jgi:hypothetical protein
MESGGRDRPKRNAKTKGLHPHTNGICDSFHKIILNDFIKLIAGKKLPLKSGISNNS